MDEPFKPVTLVEASHRAHMLSVSARRYIEKLEGELAEANARLSELCSSGAYPDGQEYALKQVLAVLKQQDKPLYRAPNGAVRDLWAKITLMIGESRAVLALAEDSRRDARKKLENARDAFEKLRDALR